MNGWFRTYMLTLRTAHRALRTRLLPRRRTAPASPPPALRTAHYALRTLLLLASSVAFAQSPRLSLIEEISNASCLPCVAENPAFERFVSGSDRAGSAITIVYHSNWPGRDTMNRVAPEIAAARVLYYSVIGVPRVMVNGISPNGSNPSWRTGAPADTLAIGSALDLVSGAISPITIGIDQTFRSDSLFVAIDLHTLEALAGMRLRIVIVEGERYYPSPQAGNNGEEHFPYIARAMLPSPEGVVLNIPAGETEHIVAGMPVDPAWSARGIYVVAFVQDDQTREVLQSATNRGSIAAASSDAAGVRTDGAAPADWRIDATSDDSNNYVVEIESDLPPLWSLSVSAAGQALADGDIMRLDHGEQLRLDVTIRPDGGNPGRGSFRVTLRGERGAIAHYEGRLYSGDIELLALRRENDAFPIARFYMPGLRRSPVSSAMIEPEDENLFEIDSASILMFVVGTRALDSADIVLLKNYLDGGGRLFLIGSEIAWGLAAPENHGEEFPRDEQFLEGELHARYVAGSSSTNALNGVPRDPVARGLGFLLRSESEMRTTPDRIVALPPARTVLGYGGSRTDAAGIRFADSSKRILFFSFGFEGIPDTALGAELMENGIRWLNGSELTLGVPSMIASGAIFGRPAPNPASGDTRIAVTLDRQTKVRVEVRDVTGRSVIPATEHVLAAGVHSILIESGGLVAGVYLVVVEAGGVSDVWKVVVE